MNLRSYSENDSKIWSILWDLYIFVSDFYIPIFHIEREIQTRMTDTEGM